LLYPTPIFACLGPARHGGPELARSAGIARDSLEAPLERSDQSLMVVGAERREVWIA